jgi:hypothetical protein
MTAMLLVLFVSAGNFALGFALAVYFGQGPGWLLPKADNVRDRLRSMLQLGRNEHRSAH